MSADTEGHSFVLDPDTCVAYIDHTLPPQDFAAAVGLAAQALIAGPENTPGVRRLGGHLRLVGAPG